LGVFFSGFKGALAASTSMGEVFVSFGAASGDVLNMFLHYCWEQVRYHGGYSFFFFFFGTTSIDGVFDARLALLRWY
jgi:hypothetical protein